MRMTTGTVAADGKIEIPGERLREGSRVTVLTTESEESFEVGEADERELLQAMAEGDRGDSISAEELFDRLARRR